MVIKRLRSALEYFDADMPQLLAWMRGSPMPLRLLDASLRGIGQVVFADSTFAGLCIALACFLPIAWQASSLQPPIRDLFALLNRPCRPVYLHSGRFQALLALPYLPRFHCNRSIILLPVINADTLCMYLLPTVDALGQRNEDFFAHGLHGFNGNLVGMGLGTFLCADFVMEPLVALHNMVFIAAASCLVVFLQLALKVAAVPVLKSPTFTLAFNLTLFISIAAAASPESSQQFSKSPHRVFGTAVTEEVLGGSCGTAYDSARAGDYFRMMFNGISQIYLVGDPISGALMLLGTMAYSRVIACCLCLGAIIGALVGAFFGASGCEISQGLWGYDSSLAFAAVYAVICSDRKQRLLLACVAAAAAAVMHGAFKVVMGQFNLPSGTLGFVFSAIAVVCCSNLLESNVEDTAAARGLDSANITASLPRSSRSGYIRSTAVSVKGVSQLSLFDNDLRFHGLDVHSALETALDDVQSGGVTAPFISMRRITRFALNAAVPEEVDAPAHAFGGLTGGHKREGYGRTMIQVNSPA